MADIENKTIEQKIDKNEDHIVDYLEIRNFLLEDENQSENIQELGNYLNNLPDREYNEIRQTLEYIMSDPEIIKIFDGIGQKVGKNEKLSNDELSVLYISAVLFGKGNGFINIGKFDLKLQIEKICNGQLLAYIQKRYNNYNYNPNKGKENNGPHIENLGRQNQYRNPNIPSPFPEKVDENEKIEREYEGLPKIPPISQRGNQYIHSYCNDIYRRAENNGYLMMAEYESRLRNEFRSHFSISELGYVNDKEFDAYVKYDKMLFAFSKYCEVINKKHEQVIKEAGYHDMDEFAQEMKYFSLFQDLVKEKYPELEVVMKRLEPYWGEMEENKKKYFEGKSDEEIEQAGHNFKEFQEFQNKKNEEYGITDDMIESLNVTPNTKEEAEDYFKNLNTVLVYQNELNEKKGEYGDTIDNYYGYMTGISEIQKKYSESDFDTIKNYSKDLQTRGQSIDFDRCSKYASLIDRTGKYGALGKDLENIGIIQEVLMDPTNEDFFILDVKNAEIAKRLRQERIDETRGNIKKYAPERYRTFTVLAGFWNGLVDSTIGVGTSLGAMITGLIGGKEHYQSQLQKKERRDNFLKINQSSSQKEAVYDGESLNFKRDNTISTVSGSVAQMLCLIYGGSAISEGIGQLGAKAGLKISASTVGKIGLFSQSFITQVGQSYGEAINSGLEGGGAFAYSMLSASVQSGLELVSPNDVLLGKGTGLGKQLISSICKNEGGIKLVGTYFLKTVGREILEENLQEGLQLAAGNLINDMVNGARNTGLDSDRNPKNFLSTAIITTLTTGITTGFSAGRQGIQMLNSNQPQLIARIASDQGLYEEVMELLNNSIEGKFNIPNVTQEQLSLLRGTLELINISQEVTTNQNNEEEQTNNEEEQILEQEIKTKEDFERIFKLIIPENENQRICLEACKQNFLNAITAKNELLGIMKGKSIKERVKLITEFLEQYQLSINESKTEINGEKIKRKEILTNEQKVLFIKAYNSLIYSPLGLSYIDSGITLGGENIPGIDVNIIKNNSMMMSIALTDIIQSNDTEKINEILYNIKQEIEDQYKSKYGKDINLTIDQIRSILNAHSEEGNIGQLELEELRKKTSDLSQTITDQELRRFLIEYGFCAETDIKIDENFSDNHTSQANMDLSGIEFNNENERESIGKNLKQIGMNLSQLQLTIGEVTENAILGEIDKITDQAEKMIARNLWVSMNEKIAEGDNRLSLEDRVFVLSQMLKYFADYRISNPTTKTPKQIFELLSSNQNKILHQHLWDLNTNTSSDHGIKHILRGNMTLAEVLFDIIETKPENISQEERDKKEQNRARLRILVRQAIIDHDLGYTNTGNRLFDVAGFDKGYEMVSDHPLRSTIYIIEHKQFYVDFFGQDGYKLLVESIPGHSNAQTESLYNVFNGTASDIETVRGILSCVDCTGSPGDYKIAFMFAQKEMIGGLFKAFSELKAGNVEGTIQCLNALKNIVESMPEGPLKEAYKKGINAFLNDFNGKMDGITTNEEKLKKLNDLFKFKMGKFLGAYGIQTSINEETGIPICGKSAEGGFAIQFELAGDSFNYLAKQFGVKTALKSFTGVSEDLIKGFEDSHAENFIIKLIETISNDGNISGKDFNLNGLEGIISQFCIDKGTQYSRNSKGYIQFQGDNNISIEITGNKGLIIHGPNGVEITLKFEGKPYIGLNNIIEKINKLETKIDESVSNLEINEGFSAAALQQHISRYITTLIDEINKEYGNSINRNEEYLDKISDDINSLVEGHATKEEIRQKIKEIKIAYNFNMQNVGTSTNPIHNQ